MSGFDACWHRLDRAAGHRTAMATIWNDYIEREPHDTRLKHLGDGRYSMQVIEHEPPPSPPWG